MQACDPIGSLPLLTSAMTPEEQARVLLAAHIANADVMADCSGKQAALAEWIERDGD